MAKCYTGCCDDPGPPCSKCSCCLNGKSSIEIIEMQKHRLVWEKQVEARKKALVPGVRLVNRIGQETTVISVTKTIVELAPWSWASVYLPGNMKKSIDGVAEDFNFLIEGHDLLNWEDRPKRPK